VAWRGSSCRRARNPQHTTKPAERFSLWKKYALFQPERFKQALPDRALSEYSVTKRALNAPEEISTMPKGQQKQAKSNKPKLSIKEKQKKKQEKAAARK
jgi:hypothetical protein